MKDACDYLAVHYFQTCRVRHWISQEVFLCPEFLFLKVYGTISNIGLDFVPSTYPSVDALAGISLPAAFVRGSPTDYRGILDFLRSMVDLDANASSSAKEERDALLVHAQLVLKDAIEYTLWGHSECFSKFTLPVMKDSMPRPVADIYSAKRHRKWVLRDASLVDAKLKSLFKFLHSKLRSGRFLFPISTPSGETPSVCDVALYSFLSVLFSIPDKYSPYFFASEDNQSEETVEIVQSLKSFLLDFDDWLWHLNSKRSQQIEEPQLIVSAQLAAVGPQVEEREEDDTNEQPAKVDRPLLGTKDRMQNLIFLAAALSTMLGAALLAA